MCNASSHTAVSMSAKQSVSWQWPSRSERTSVPVSSMLRLQRLEDLVLVKRAFFVFGDGLSSRFTVRIYPRLSRSNRICVADSAPAPSPSVTASPMPGTKQASLAQVARETGEQFTRCVEVVEADLTSVGVWLGAGHRHEAGGDAAAEIWMERASVPVTPAWPRSVRQTSASQPPPRGA